MKKMLAVLFSICFALALTLPTFAAGTDDGSLTVATKDGAKYFGTPYTEGCTKYLAANGDGSYYYDMSGDKDMDICDLVSLHLNEVDFDLDGAYDSDDAKAFRIILMDSEN